jgi:hypothetical protein
MKVKKVAEALDLKLAEFFKKGKVSTDLQATHRPGLMKQYVGMAFELEAKERIRGRFRGEVSKEAMPELCTELAAWGQSLVIEVGIPAIERAQFDRVTEHAVAAHNTVITIDRATKALTKRKSCKETKQESKGIFKRSAEEMAQAREYMRPPAPLTLGQLMGQTE